MQNLKNTVAIDILNRIRSRGCKISLDDFGTGYSSLSYLRRIPADELKLDRSFLSEIETTQEALWIVDGVLGIAQSLKMKTVVEGLETREQVDLVRSLGCDVGQGFLFGKPRPASEALAAASGLTQDEVYSVLARPKPEPEIKVAS